MDISGEFVIIGIDDEEEPHDVAEFEPATVLPVSQRLYWESDEDWQRSGEAGYAHGAFTLSRRGKLVGSLAFTFDGEDGLVAMGAIPFDGHKSFDDGVLAIVGGTGGFKGRTGEVHVQTRNPKRYRISTDG